MCLVLFVCVIFFFVKQKTAYEMRIRYWSSDVCSSDLVGAVGVFVEFAFGMAPVHAEAQDMVGADRRAQLDLAAEPGRGRVALIEDELVARRTDHLVGEVARLEIGERIELPAAAMDEADTRVVGGRSTVGAGEASGARSEGQPG